MDFGYLCVHFQNSSVMMMGAIYESLHRMYADNPSAITQKLATTEIVIDRMHFKGHKDSWCRETCDPSKFEELKK